LEAPNQFGRRVFRMSPAPGDPQLAAGAAVRSQNRGASPS
jgi:hypothetical protein